MKKWYCGASITAGLVAVTLVQPVLAIIDPTAAPGTPCVASRSVDAAIQTGIALACQESLIDIPEAVCSDYLAQQLTLATLQFCGNQTEAFAHCTKLPDVSFADCQYFDPAGVAGGIAPDCTQETLDAYNICGNSTGSDLFAAGNPVALAQCLFYDLSLCTPEDGEGHFDAVFMGAVGECPVPGYVPACGVVAVTTMTTATATTTALPNSVSSFSSSPSSSLSSSSISSSSSAASSFQTTEAGPSVSTVTTSTPTAAPTAPPQPPPPGGASSHFHLTLNGTFSTFISVTGGVTSDPAQAQAFYIYEAQLFTPAGLRVQAEQGATADQPAPYVAFVGSNGTLPFSTSFTLVTAGVDPLSMEKKRQAVGLTTLYWTNAAFAAPGATADFCVYFSVVYALFQAGTDIYESCQRVTLNALYIQTPESPSISSTSATMTAKGSVIASATSTLFPTISCAIGRTLFAYTTVYR